MSNVYFSSYMAIHVNLNFYKDFKPRLDHTHIKLILMIHLNIIENFLFQVDVHFILRILESM